MLLAIDPGTTQSAWVQTYSTAVITCGLQDNRSLLRWISDEMVPTDHLAIEMVASYGMPVGREVFETVLWTGRFIQAFPGEHTLIYRQDVKLHLCKQARAKDANIRQALLDRFGPGKEKAVGTKKNPGPLYGVKSHIWSALAVAVTWQDAQ